MASQTLSANAVAREATSKAGRTVTDKQVRGLARATLARFDKTKYPAYQSHDYTRAEATRLVAVFVARAKGRAINAPTPRKRTRKVATPATPVQS